MYLQHSALLAVIKPPKWLLAPTDSWDYEAEFKRYNDCSDTTRAVVEKFLAFKFTASSIEIPDQLKNYQCSAGCFDSSATYDLNWPPLNERSYQLHSFDLQSPSLKLILSTIPGSKGRDLFHDLFTKRTPIRNGRGERKSDEEITELHTNPELHKLHESFAKEVYEQSRAKVHFVYGGRRRKFLEKTWPGKFKRMNGLSKYRICEAEINGRKRLFVFLLHPEYMNNPKWRRPEVMDAVVEVLKAAQHRINTMDRLEGFIIALDEFEATLRTCPAIEKVISQSVAIRKSSWVNPPQDFVDSVQPWLDKQVPADVCLELQRKYWQLHERHYRWLTVWIGLLQ